MIFDDSILTLQKSRMPQIQGVKGALQQRAHSPSRFIGTEGLASESENGTVPYSGSFSSACCRELQPVVIYREPLTTQEMRHHPAKGGKGKQHGRFFAFRAYHS